MQDLMVNHWRTRVQPWRKPDDRLAWWQLTSTGGLWIIVWIVTGQVESRFGMWAILLVPLHSVLMIRLFVLMHDCSHGSFFHSRRTNEIVGFWLGALFLTPFREWRRSHAIPHATASCLERRNRGDIYTMTEAEYNAASRFERWKYRMMRNPLIMLGLGPIVVFGIKHRIKGSLCEGMPRGTRWIRLQATTLTSFALGLLGCWILGTRVFLTIWLLSFWLAAAVGIFLFYMQHNFEGVYYARERGDYSFELAGIEGASYFDLPRFAHWCIGNIGYHHIHHLDPVIPNYRLSDCHEACFQTASIKQLGFRVAIGTLRLKLFVPDEQRMITWSEWKSRQPP